VVFDFQEKAELEDSAASTPSPALSPRLRPEKLSSGFAGAGQGFPDGDLTELPGV